MSPVVPDPKSAHEVVERARRRPAKRTFTNAAGLHLFGVFSVLFNLLVIIILLLLIKFVLRHFPTGKGTTDRVEMPVSTE